jgi:tRNA pseudouridine32 synthase / 23S rRNA pseudouridine746 synthase
VNFSPPTKEGVGASRCVLPAGAWPTLLDYLAHRFKAASPDEWLARMQRDEVLDAFGNALSPHTPYQPGATVYYYRHRRDEPRIPFEERVLFQDDLLVVVDKPHFLPVISTGRFVRESLLARLKRSLGIDTLAPMHRIDRDTAGLVAFTVQPNTRDRYAALFRDRRIEKKYEAIAAWRDDLDFPYRHRSRLVEGDPFMQMREVEGEANSDTHIEVLERLGQRARYRLTPVTGKKHQLRAHMAALGMPIMNDSIYPTLQPHRDDDYTKPLQLLAKELCFLDPVLGSQRHFVSLLELAADTVR